MLIYSIYNIYIIYSYVNLLFFFSSPFKIRKNCFRNGRFSFPILWAGLSFFSAGVSTLVFLATEEESPLFAAIDENGLEKLQQIIVHGADLEEKDADVLTPLQRAITWENNKAAKLLLEHGADVNTTNNWGLTPLINAVFYEANPETLE